MSKTTLAVLIALHLSFCVINVISMASAYNNHLGLPLVLLCLVAFGINAYFLVLRVVDILD